MSKSFPINYVEKYYDNYFVWKLWLSLFLYENYVKLSKILWFNYVELNNMA